MSDRDLSDRDSLVSDYAGLAKENLTEEDLIALGEDDPDDRTDVTTDAMESSDNAQPYFAPTDPPVIPGGRDNAELAQGFAPTSEGIEPAGDMPTDDDTITERVQRLLRADAATSELDLEVETRDQVVYLRGVVPSIDDGDLAVDVASRLPTVLDVVDETTVGG